MTSLQSGNFTQHAFTSTLHNKKRSSYFNKYIVIVTALFFFTILSWFNFALSWYATITTNDPDHEDQTLSSLGFALIWTFITLTIYFLSEYFDLLSSYAEDSGHPLLREGRDISRSFSTDGESLGAIDMSAI